MRKLLEKLKKIIDLCGYGAWLCMLFVQYLILSTRHIAKKLGENEKKILFTLEDDRLYRDRDGSGRYAYLMLDRFSRAGYNVYYYRNMNFKTFVELRDFGRYIYSIKNLKIINKLPENTENMVYIFDSAIKEVASQKWKKMVFFNHLKPVSCSLGNMINIPYFMHPNMYYSKAYDRVKTFRDNKRKMRIFMGGNISMTWYDNPRLWNYGQITRLEGIRAIFQINDGVRLKWNVGEFREFLKQTDYVNQCVLLKTDHSLALPSEEWASIVGSSDFFFCMSGTDVPMCHNAIESMAVGTIPIIAYQDWFFPALEHGKNAIVYSGKEDLVEKVKEVLAMSEEEILRMRKNVIDYYDTYLSDSDFIKRFESEQGAISTIMLHPRWISDENEEAEGQQVFSEIKQLLGDMPKSKEETFV